MTRKLVAGASAGALAIALAFIPPHEGRSLLAYLDPIGIPTICEGWTRGVKLGDTATEAQCDELTLKGIQEADEIFVAWVPEAVRDSLSDRTYAAFLSFIYNVGPGKKGVKDGFVFLKRGGHSTMLKKLQAGEVKEACNQLPYWANAGGKPLRGLQIRRAEERKLCLSMVK